MFNCKVCVVFWYINMLGESIWGVFGLVDIVICGLVFSMVLIFIENVVEILCFRGFLWFMSKLFKIFFELYIIFFYILLKWEVWGGLNIYEILFFLRFCVIMGYLLG